MTKKQSKPKMGRPPLPPDKRRGASMGFRPTPTIRAELEEAARANGRSMSHEVEVRLERSFQQEANSGGRQLHGLLRLLVGAAEIIQARTGKSASDDWKTGIAVDRAWKRLIHDWLPRPPAKWIAEVERLSDAVPDKPERPRAPARGGLLVRPATDEEWEVYQKGSQNFEKDLETFMIAFDEYQAAVRKIQKEFNKAIGIGDEALGLLSDHEK